MKNFNISICIILLVLSSSCKESKQMEFTVFKGATVFDGNGKTIENAILIIKDDQIVSIGDSTTPLLENIEIIDLSNKYITPGFIDSHVHFIRHCFYFNTTGLAEKYPWYKMDAYQKGNYERYYDSYLRSGVTSVFDLGGPSWTIGLQEESKLSPTIASCGPLITPFVFGLKRMTDPVFVFPNGPKEAKEMIRDFHYQGATGIKLWRLKLDDPDYRETVEVISKEADSLNNFIVFHATDLKEAIFALQKGAKVLAHSVDDIELTQEIIDLALENEVSYIPTLFVRKAHIQHLKYLLGEVQELNDPNKVIDSFTMQMYRQLPLQVSSSDSLELQKALAERLSWFQEDYDMKVKNLLLAYNSGIEIAVGTDAGTPGNFHGPSIFEEMEAFQAAGIPAEDIIKMVTQNGARAMRKIDVLGTIEEGKMTDLVILNQDPSKDIAKMRSLSHVVKKGEIIPVDVPIQ